MKQWAFNIIAAGSLALGVLTAGLWVRSYWFEDSLSWFQSWRKFNVFIGVGEIGLQCYPDDYADTMRPEGFDWSVSEVPEKELDEDDPETGEGEGMPPSAGYSSRSRVFRILGVQYNRGLLVDQGFFLWGWFFSIPFWLLTALTSVPPALWVVRRIRRRASPGRCPECGRESCTSPLTGDCTLRGPASRSLPGGSRGPLPPGDSP